MDYIRRRYNLLAEEITLFIFFPLLAISFNNILGFLKSSSSNNGHRNLKMECIKSNKGRNRPNGIRLGGKGKERRCM